MSPTTPEELSVIIKRLPNKYSAGTDEIPDIIIKASVTSIVDPLTDIFNSSFMSVFLLRLTAFLNKENIISDAQHGFSTGRSIQSAIYTFLNEIISAVDNKQHMSGIFLDLTKAFNVIDDNTLLQKLGNYGIQGLPNKWIHSYLNDHQQITQIKYKDIKTQKICNFYSNAQNITYGVPQGSVLWPILFIFYVNDLSEKITKGTTVLFADDANIQIKSHDEESLQKTATGIIQNLTQWTVLFADDANIQIKSHDEESLQKTATGIIQNLTQWFRTETMKKQ
ncbi:uncharacterized protein LOC124788383 [Schistocerca piceifrons]|uniref:uncharacterized protein LOC124788383 n=1 Tax=Schistocerca piceifrons TaxID=274613 RepID=UPI001F5E5B41|nr:uncharacterized protein LOC124788383 [Schistocerca piceifrons]